MSRLAVMARLLVADNVKAVLQERGLSQNDLAKAMSVNAATASRWCTGQTELAVGHLAEIATFAGVPIGRLVQGV